MANLAQFIREVKIEMAKVVWPTGRQLVIYTLVVIVMSVVIAAFLGLLDLGFQTLLTKYLLK